MKICAAPNTTRNNVRHGSRPNAMLTVVLGFDRYARCLVKLYVKYETTWVPSCEVISAYMSTPEALLRPHCAFNKLMTL